MCLKNTVIAAIMLLSLFPSKQCIIKQLLDSVFVISGIIKGSVSVNQRHSASADNTYFDLDYSGYRKNLIQ